MSNFKAGDKVVKTNGRDWSDGSEYKEIVSVNSDGISCHVKLFSTTAQISELKLYKPKYNHLEVLRNIKTGEVWVAIDNSITITKTKEGLIIIGSNSALSKIIIDTNTEYTLTKTSVSFQEAFLAYEDGGVIESEVDHEIFYNSKEGEGCCFSPKQIRGMWFINN
ncbi:hypothetical protein [Clostridium sp.]|uniref:hypothetical protein n=1 Tax=Clostridium sp. TaxID=1506 RepID=UPI002FCC9555